VGVEERCALAGVGEADAFGGTGRASEEGGTEEALEVEDEVEALGAEVLEEAKELGGEARGGIPAGEALAVEKDDVVELRVVGEQAGTAGGHEPGDVGGGVGGAEEVEDGECVDDVADGGGLDEQDALGGGHGEIYDLRFAICDRGDGQGL
jgi:hypothetical protein